MPHLPEAKRIKAAYVLRDLLAFRDRDTTTVENDGLVRLLQIEEMSTPDRMELERIAGELGWIFGDQQISRDDQVLKSGPKERRSEESYRLAQQFLAFVGHKGQIHAHDISPTQSINRITEDLADWIDNSGLTLGNNL